jgi:hypothetical protein
LINDTSRARSVYFRPTERLEALVCRFLDHVDHVVDGDDADQPVCLSTTGRDKIVFAEQPRHL